MTKKLKIRDLTLRDGQQSLFATRLSQKSIDVLLPYYKDAGFYAMEVWGGAVPDSVMRYLDESPWVRLKSISDQIQGKSYLTALSRGRNLFGYVPYPTSVIDGFYKEAIANGLGIMRIFDALNDLDNVKESVEIINKLGGIPDGAVCYTVDPKDEPVEVEVVEEEEVPASGFFARLLGKKEVVKTVKKVKQEPEKIFTDEYFVEKAKGYEKLGAKIITLKDMAGLVNPARIATLMPKLKAAVNVPIDFHTHCTPGYGLASGLMAILHDVDILDTNIWWFGEGSAAPAIELIYVFAKKLGVEVEVNMEAVGKIREELKGIRECLKDFDLHKDNFPKAFDPLKDTLPAEIDAQFDKAIAAAKANDEEALLAACHAIEDYFNFPKPNLIVKEAEVPGGMYSNMVAQLRQLKAEDVLEDAMKLIPKVRRDAGLVPLVTPTSQIVGSQAVMVALSRKSGTEDYKNVSNQFASLVRGEYGKTPVAIDSEFRKQITGSAQEVPYDVNSYKSPENPVLAKYGNVKLAKDNKEYLLLELLPNVAKTFLENRRAEEFAAAGGVATTPAPEVKAEKPVAEGPVTGPTLNAPMGGTVVEIHVKPGDKVKKGQSLLMYEAMKMQNEIESDGEYTIKRILVAAGDVVANGQPLVEFEVPNAPVAEEGPVTGPTLNAPMGGTVVEIYVKPGDSVKNGQSLLMYEAMKMQNEIASEGNFVVKRILVNTGDVVAAGQALIEFVG